MLCILCLLAESSTTCGNLANVRTKFISFSSATHSLGTASFEMSLPDFLRSLQALACAYCIDAHPLSKLNASSHLNVMCFSGESLAIKNLIAPIPICSAIGRTSSGVNSGFLFSISALALLTASSTSSSTDMNTPLLVDIEPSGNVMNS